MKNKPKLFVLVGLSGSGKSTFAQELAEKESAVIVSSDGIREEILNNYEDQGHNAEVFNIFHERIRKALKNKQNVIADATNITMKSRRIILTNVRAYDVEKICYVLPKAFEDCIADNKKRLHPVPIACLNKQIREFQIPFKEEGWDQIIVKKFPNKMDLYKISCEMAKFDQKTPYHNKKLGLHCSDTWELFGKFDYPPYYSWAVLYHDVGKLYTQSFDKDGIGHYYGHAEVSSYLMLSYLQTRFNTPVDDKLLNMCFLINYHMLPFDWETDKTKQRWKEHFGEYKYQMLLDFHECDIAR